MSLFFHSIPNWLELCFLAFSIGILTNLLWVLPPKASDDVPGHERLLSRLWTLFTVSVFAMLAAVALDLVMRSAEMSGEAFTEILSVLPTVVFHTHYGSVWLIRTAVLVVAAFLAFRGMRYRTSRGLIMILLVLAAVVSLTESASGHAADAGDFSLIEITDWLHLLAASVWSGGLLALSFIVLPVLSTAGALESRYLADAVSRFSRIAGLAVCVIVLSAPYNAWTYVGSFTALFGSSYGWMLIAKTVLFLCLLYAGALNRYVTMPGMRKAAGLPEGRAGIIGGLLAPVLVVSDPGPEDRTARGLMRRVKVEVVLILAVLLCAAMLRHEAPAKHYQHQQGEHHPYPHH